jgi:hypothetical protein
MFPAASERRYYEQEIATVEAKWRLLDDKRRYAQLLIVGGAIFLPCSFIKTPWVNDETVSALALLMLVVSGIWLIDLRSRLRALTQRSLALKETLCEASSPPDMTSLNENSNKSKRPSRRLPAKRRPQRAWPRSPSFSP